MSPWNSNILLSSKKQDWSTPSDFFDKLSWRFGPFDLDPCATPHNTKCVNFYTEAEDGLSKDWAGHTVFCNPPYGRSSIDWIQKAYKESRKENTKVVMLLPARTDTIAWHKYVMKADEIYFVKGRLKFGDSQNAAPFPSAVVVFSGFRETENPRIGTINR